MKFGAHISTAKPFSDSIIRAEELGCDCMQIFANPPQRWNPATLPEAEIKRFRELNAEAKIGPIIIHSIYLINLASENPFYYESSIKSLIDDMKKAHAIGALGVNSHMGSTKGREFNEVLVKITLAIKNILMATEGGPDFIIENSAGAGNIIGDTIEEIAKIIQSVNSPRVKVLIDTAHAFESGYDLKTKEGLEKFIAEFDKEIGLDKLVGFHLNDSKTALDSKRDRHADIGAGDIGLDAFRRLVNHPKLKDKFGILETPQDQISWSDQLKLLREL
ncbi:MAG: deoxyribonuclease IV [bacterium]|nr:deoxyribonuclease IV [bacterium]